MSVFLRFLVELGKSIGLKPRLSMAMRKMIGQVETLSMIQGTRLFKEIETVLKEYQSGFAVTTPQKTMADQYERLRILKKMAALELTRDLLEE